MTPIPIMDRCQQTPELFTRELALATLQREAPGTHGEHLVFIWPEGSGFKNLEDAEEVQRFMRCRTGGISFIALAATNSHLNLEAAEVKSIRAVSRAG